MDAQTAQALYQLKIWWKADPIATMQQVIAAPGSFSEIAGTEIGQHLLSPEVGRAIETVLELTRRIEELEIEYSWNGD